MCIEHIGSENTSNNELDTAQVLDMLKILYDRAEYYHGLFFVKPSNGTFKIVNKAGEDIAETNYSDIVTNQNCMFANSYGSWGLVNDSDLEKLVSGKRSSKANMIVQSEFIREVQKLPNGAILIDSYGRKGLMGSNGYALLDIVYSVLKPLEAKPDGTQPLYYVINLGYGTSSVGIINISPNGDSVDKSFVKPIGDMLEIHYLKTNLSRRLNSNIDELLTKSKKAIAYNGTLVSKKCYDDVIPDRQLERFELVKVIDYVGNTVTVGLVSTYGKEIIPTGKYYGIEVLNPSYYLCRVNPISEDAGQYVLYHNSEQIDIKHKIVGYRSFIDLPIVSLIIEDDSGTKQVVSYGNDGKLHRKIYMSLDIWEYIPDNLTSGPGYFLVKLYDKYYYTDREFRILNMRISSELSKVSPNNWVKRTFDCKSDILD